MKRSSSLLRRTGARHYVLMVAVAAIGGCGSGTLADESTAQAGKGGTDCPAGSEGCACYGNDTCNAGLTCASHLCVNLGTGGGGQAGASPVAASGGGAAQGGVSVGGTWSGGSGTGGTAGCALGNPCSTPNSFCVEGNIVCQCINGAWGSCTTTGSGGAGSATGGRYSLGGFPTFTGGVPATGGRATGGSNNPAGCPATQPANRTACTQGTGTCTYGTQLCQCGQFYSATWEWSCGNAPPATGGTTGSGGRPAGGTASGGLPSGGSASGGFPAGGTPAVGGTATGGMVTGGTSSGGAPPIGGTGAGGVACMPGAECSGAFTCTPYGSGLCICAGSTLTCVGVQGGASGSAGSPGTAGNAGAGGVACMPGAGCSGVFTCTPDGGGLCLCTGSTVVCVNVQGGASGSAGSPGTAGNAGAGGAGTDCAVGMPCGEDLSTCTQDPGDGGTPVTCYCAGGTYAICV